MEDLVLILGVGITFGFVCLAVFSRKARRAVAIVFTILLIVGAIIALVLMFAQG